jgi:hypothetical protein
VVDAGPPGAAADVANAAGDQGISAPTEQPPAGPLPSGDQVVDAPPQVDVLQVAARAPAKTPFLQREPAPEFPPDYPWFNSKPLTKNDLKGKFVLLDFWTYCCINCMHVLPTLRAIEDRRRADPRAWRDAS